MRFQRGSALLWPIFALSSPSFCLQVAGQAAPTPHFSEAPVYAASFCQFGNVKWPYKLCWEITGGIFAVLFAILVSIPLGWAIIRFRAKRRLDQTMETAEPDRIAKALEIFHQAEAKPETLSSAQRLAVEGKKAWRDSMRIESGEYEKGRVNGLKMMGESEARRGHVSQGSSSTGRTYTPPPPRFSPRLYARHSQPIAPDFSYPPQANPASSPSRSLNTDRTPRSRTGSTDSFPTQQDPHSRFNSSSSNSFSPQFTPAFQPTHSRSPTYATLPPHPHPHTPEPPLNRFRPQSDSSSTTAATSSSMMSPFSPDSPVKLTVQQSTDPRLAKDQLIFQEEIPSEQRRSMVADQGVLSETLFQFPQRPLPTADISQLPPNGRPRGEALGFHLPARLMARRAASIDSTSLATATTCATIRQNQPTPIHSSTAQAGGRLEHLIDILPRPQAIQRRHLSRPSTTRTSLDSDPSFRPPSVTGPVIPQPALMRSTIISHGSGSGSGPGPGPGPGSASRPGSGSGSRNHSPQNSPRRSMLDKLERTEANIVASLEKRYTIGTGVGVGVGVDGIQTGMKMTSTSMTGGGRERGSMVGFSASERRMESDSSTASSSGSGMTTRSDNTLRKGVGTDGEYQRIYLHSQLPRKGGGFVVMNRPGSLTEGRG